MSYQDMTISELRKLCKNRAIPYPSNAKKVNLVALLEACDAATPIEVEAVTVDDSIIPANALAIDGQALQEAAVALTEAIDSAATALGEFDVDDEALADMSVGDIRVCEEGIAQALRYVDESRKELTRMLTAPKKLVDDKCKGVTEPLKALAGRYAEARDAVYMKGYEAQYQECCIANGIEALMDAVPFDAFIAMHPRWTARTANPVKTQEKIAEEVERVASDWRKLRGLRNSMRHYAEAEREFFATLDLQAAIDRDITATVQQERVDALNREREENERWMAEQAARAQEPPQMPVFDEVEPESVPTPEPPAGDAYAREAAHLRELTAEHVANGHPNRRLYHFEAWLDDAELASFREWKNACGVGTGWTFREVRNG